MCFNMVVHLDNKGIATSPDLVGDMKQIFQFYLHFPMCKTEIVLQIFSLSYLNFPECIPDALSWGLG